MTQYIPCDIPGDILCVHTGGGREPAVGADVTLHPWNPLTSLRVRTQSSGSSVRSTAGWSPR